MSSKVAQCFLSGLDSTHVLMHALRVYDPVSSTVDEVYISDVCFKQICHGKDEEVANFWSAYKQALSAGYTDSGFISGLVTELQESRHELALCSFPQGQGVFLLAYTPRISKASGQLRLWCRSRVPIPWRIVESALSQNVPLVTAGNWPWIGQRWLIATPPLPDRPVYFAQPEFQGPLYRQATQRWGDPPDLFVTLANNTCSAGYELVRRGIL